MSSTLLGALLGLGVAVGLLLAVGSAPPFRPVRLVDRLTPYLRDSPRPSRLLGTTSAPSVPAAARRLLTPLLKQAAQRVDTLLGGRASVRRRLDALGSRQTVEDFRLEQVMWGAAGLGLGVVGGVLITLASGQVAIASVLLLAVGGAVAGVLGRDWWLGRQLRVYEERLLAEFPVVAELLALAVTAGEGPIGAIDRVSRLTGGALGAALGQALARARAGESLADALQSLADRTSLEPLARFVDGVVVAIERGTPLAEVLRAQAADVREAGKRRLLEQGGRKEIAMMVPVVFLILPITVIFALFPGLFAIVRLSQ